MLPLSLDCQSRTDNPETRATLRTRNRNKENQNNTEIMINKDLTKTKSGEVYGVDWFIWFIVFNTTFNNITATSWRSVFLVEVTEYPGGTH